MAEEVKPEDSAQEPAVEKQAEPAAPAQSDELADLRRQMDALKASERQAREDAERARAEAAARANEAIKFRSEAERAQYHGVERAIEGANARLNQLESDLAAAYSAGDIPALTKAQREIGALSARKAQMEDGRDAMKARLEQAARQPAPQQQPAQPTNPVEALASRLSPRSAAWVRAHPDAASNTTKLFAVAQYATGAKGIEADSDAFFDYVEKEMGYKRDAAENKTPTTYNRRSGLPAGRVTSGPVGRREVTAENVQITPAIEEAAKTSGISAREYVDSYLRLVKNGEISDTLGVMG